MQPVRSPPEGEGSLAHRRFEGLRIEAIMVLVRRPGPGHRSSQKNHTWVVAAKRLRVPNQSVFAGSARPDDGNEVPGTDVCVRV